MVHWYYTPTPSKSNVGGGLPHTVIELGGQQLSYMSAGRCEQCIVSLESNPSTGQVPGCLQPYARFAKPVRAPQPRARGYLYYAGFRALACF